MDEKIIITNDEKIITIDRIIVVFIYFLFLLTNRHTFFRCIYTGLFLFNAYYIIRHKLSLKLKPFIQYFLIYLISYFLIKDPNPFYYLMTFYLPMPNFFRAIFIIIFITYFNNWIINSNNNNTNKNKEEKEEKEKNEEKNNEKENKKEIEEKSKNNNEIFNTYFLSKEIKYLLSDKNNLLTWLIVLILLRLSIYFYDIKYWMIFDPKNLFPDSPSSNPDNSKNNNNTMYYISAVVYNMEPIIKDWIEEMKKVIDYLGPQNVIVSIYENGDSTDKTRKYLNFFGNYLINHKIINKINLEKIEEKKDVDRILFLSRLRNRSLDLLYSTKNINFSNTKIIFFNDIIYRYEDIIKLIKTNNENYDAVCGMDYYDGFYDIGASIGLDGKQFRKYFPYMYNKEQQDAYINGETIRTFSCWNGVTVVNAKPFEDRNKLFFRKNKNSNQSECLLLHADMYFMGYKKVLVNTQIAVSYTYNYYYLNHYLYPWTINLITYFYYYFRYGFIKRNYNLTNLIDNDIDMDKNLEQLVLKYMIKK